MPLAVDLHEAERCGNAKCVYFETMTGPIERHAASILFEIGSVRVQTVCNEHALAATLPKETKSGQGSVPWQGT
jgi:hypothetical protein